MHRLQELVRLHRLGTPVREIARLLQMSPNTERQYRLALQQAQLLDGTVDQLPETALLMQAVQHSKPTLGETPRHELSTVEPYREIVQQLVDKRLRARAIFDRLRLEHPETFNVSYDAMKRFVRRLRADKGVLPQDIAIPVLTEPGDVAQVDFGYAGRFFDPQRGVLRKAWTFVMVLAFSRHMFAKLVFDQRVETWIRLHVEAFTAFGGAPTTLVPDNLKAAVIRSAFGLGDQPGLNRSYQDLARHYGFKIDPTPPRAPEKKGKVESAVKYVKRNGLAGREGQDINDVNTVLAQWTRDIAGQRVHGVTGRKPLEIFETIEHDQLTELPRRRYEITIWKQAKVHQDAHVVFDKRLYSVPWRWCGRSVWIAATASSVAIFGEDVRIATHDRRGVGTHSTQEHHLPEHRRDFRHRGRDFWMARAERLGPQTAGLIAELFDSDSPLSPLRAVQCIVTHLEGFPKSRAEAASKRARYFGIQDYRGIKEILAKALDMDPLPQLALPLTDDETPRFARSTAELLASLSEVSDESH
jgi:transposase